MRIAQLAPLAEAVPPKLYGGTERVVSYLTEELVRLGHDVTLFASGDSQTSARLVACAPRALRLDPRVRDPLPHHLLMIERVRSRAHEFDVLHFHVEHVHLPLFRRLAWFGIPLGVGASLLAAVIATHHVRGQNDGAFQLATGLAMLGNLPASLGYVGAVVLAFHGRWRRWVAALAPAGRMALTNYLLQSLAGTLFFYGYGLGHWGMGRAGQLVFVCVAFALQLLVSRWWLSRYRYGPMEWLWRGFTYLRWPRMRQMAVA